MNLKLDLSCFNWVKCVMQDKGLPPPSRHLALYLSMNSKQDVAWPSISETVEDTGYSRPTVIKHYAILQERGWLVKDKNRPRGGTTYTISFPQWVEQLAEGIK